MGNFLKTALMATFLFLSILQGHGQIYNTDPFKIKGFNIFQLPISKPDVLTNKIKKVSLVTYELKKDGTKRKKGFSNYYVEFNNNGNPTHYHEKIFKPCWWWPNLLQNLHLQKESSTEYNYIFNYDSLQNLIHAQEIIIKNDYSASKDVNDIYNWYSNNLLTTQIISEKTIYKPGYKYHGVSYPDDTTITKYFLHYSKNSFVSTIYICRNSRSDIYVKEKCDSIVFNCSFDSIFLNREFSGSINRDSARRTVETIIPVVHALTIDGYCISPESPYDIILTYFYDKDWKLEKVEQFTRKGDFISREFLTYDTRGLPLINKYENLRVIECYEYEYY